jgi:predicted DNA-binding ArsR family transcriptional regulator
MWYVCTNVLVVIMASLKYLSRILSAAVVDETEEDTESEQRVRVLPSTATVSMINPTQRVSHDSIPPHGWTSVCVIMTDYV